MTGVVGFIEGRVARKTSNALTMNFSDGPGEPFATALQGAGDGKGAKFGTLLGFKNGGAGTHILTYATGGQLRIASRDAKPTVLSDGDGAEVATVTRGDTSTATAPDGSEILRFVSDPNEPKTPELFRALIVGPAGEPVGELEVVRKVAGWNVRRALVDAIEMGEYWWDRPGEPLKLPLLGTRVMLMRALSPLERQVIIGACVDMAIGLRPYTTEMK